MVGLDPDDMRPPYAQVVDALRQEIEQGILQPGAKLPTHQHLVTQYGVSVGTIKRALGELQGAGLVVSRQGQGAFVRTRRSVLESVPHSFSADLLAGYWVTSYEFKSGQGMGTHADITRITPQSHRRITAKNYPPEPRTDGHAPFRNEVEAQLASRHLIGNWKNVSDTRYFGSIHLAVMPGENVMRGHYTAVTSDVEVGSVAWIWVRVDPASLSAVKVADLRLKDPSTIRKLLAQRPNTLPVPVSDVAEEGSQG